jgi:predicted component of type VI protein secretion system
MPRLALVALCAFVLTACPVLASDPSARSAASVPSIPPSHVPVAVLDESTVNTNPLEVGPADLAPPESQPRCVIH